MTPRICFLCANWHLFPNIGLCWDARRPERGSRMPRCMRMCAFGIYTSPFGVCGHFEEHPSEEKEAADSGRLF